MIRTRARRSFAFDLACAWLWALLMHHLFFATKTEFPAPFCLTFMLLCSLPRLSSFVVWEQRRCLDYIRSTMCKKESLLHNYQKRWQSFWTKAKPKKCNQAVKRGSRVLEAEAVTCQDHFSSLAKLGGLLPCLLFCIFDHREPRSLDMHYRHVKMTGNSPFDLSALSEGSVVVVDIGRCQCQRQSGRDWT